MQKFRQTISKYKKIRTSLPKDVLIFFVFFIISTFLWFLYTLSKPQEDDLTFAIRYKNIPPNYVLTQTLPKTLHLRVKDIGFNLLLNDYYHSTKEVDIDMKNRFNSDEKPFYLTYKDLRKGILSQISQTATIINFAPRYILVTYDKLSQKVLPVKFVGNINLYQQYTLSGEIQIKPKQVKVYGAKSVLDTMKAVYIKPVELMDLNATKQLRVDIDLKNNIITVPRQVDVLIPVELFTEKTIAVPVDEQNFPKNIQLRTFPATVNVTFLVGLSHFQEVNADNIQVYLEYNTIVKNKKGKQKVSVQPLVPYISNIRVSPDAVEYIMEEENGRIHD